MDKFWSIFSMPIGLLFCFGPAIIAWILAERNKQRADKGSDRH